MFSSDKKSTRDCKNNRRKENIRGERDCTIKAVSGDRKLEYVGERKDDSNKNMEQGKC